MEDETMNITSAIICDAPEYVPKSITAIIDGVTMGVPMDPRNRHYAEIMRQVDAGTLVIESQP